MWACAIILEKQPLLSFFGNRKFLVAFWWWGGVKWWWKKFGCHIKLVSSILLKKNCRHMGWRLKKNWSLFDIPPPLDVTHFTKIFKQFTLSTSIMLITSKIKQNKDSC
jgi:hypothetical protein